MAMGWPERDAAAVATMIMKKQKTEEKFNAIAMATGERRTRVSQHFAGASTSMTVTEQSARGNINEKERALRVLNRFLHSFPHITRNECARTHEATRFFHQIRCVKIASTLATMLLVFARFAPFPQHFYSTQTPSLLPHTHASLI